MILSLIGPIVRNPEFQQLWEVRIRFWRGNEEVPTEAQEQRLESPQVGLVTHSFAKSPPQVLLLFTRHGSRKSSSRLGRLAVKALNY